MAMPPGPPAGRDDLLAGAVRGDTQASTGTAVSISSVTFAYPGIHVLDSLDFAVRRGRVVGVVGPSGCGKSTLLSLVAGLNAPTSGTIEVMPGAAGRHPLSMLFQQDTLLPWLNARDNICLFAKFQGIRRRTISERVANLIREAGLEKFETAFPYQLSGGMRRRVAFLTAIAPLPEILLLDEPFSSLDEPTRISIHQVVLDIVRQLEMTVILVTHDLAEAITLSDEIVMLTRRPGSVSRKYEVPFPRSRKVLELRNTDQFLSLYGQLWDDLAKEL
jgi:NitT/TauT family transport system ATP-binding protein